MATELKQSISIGVTPSLLNKVDTEAKELGMTRSAFFSMCANIYFRTMEAQEVLRNANDLLAKAQALQNSEQINLWNMEVESKK